MKPVAPPMASAEPAEDESSIQSEVLRLCDERDRGDRITLPAPPSPETLRAATPFPPASERDVPMDTIPTPPPSASRKRADSASDEAVPSTIPGPPRVPRIAGL
ncbi:MAG: hypothetical protein ACRELB_16235 [Polyangiaceae bacterium]